MTLIIFVNLLLVLKARKDEKFFEQNPLFNEDFGIQIEHRNSKFVEVLDLKRYNLIL